MSRGYIYGTAREIMDIPEITESMFYEKAGSEAEYFSDEEPSEFFNIHTYLKNMNVLYGAEIGTEDKDGESIPYIVFTDKVKESFFVNRYHQLKQKVDNMTLHDFSTNVGELKGLVEATYADCIYCESVLQTEDTFIRNAECGVRYYFSTNIVCMH